MSFRKSVLVPVEKYKNLLEVQTTMRRQETEDRKSPDNTKTSSPKPEVEGHKERDTKDAWVKQLSPEAAERAESLLRHIERTGALSWDGEGRILVSGRLLPNTNIHELVTDCVEEDKKPQGYMDFCEALAKSDTPPRLIVNTPRRLFIQDLQDSSEDETEEPEEMEKEQKQERESPWICW